MANLDQIMGYVADNIPISGTNVIRIGKYAIEWGNAPSNSGAISVIFANHYKPTPSIFASAGYTASQITYAASVQPRYIDETVVFGANIYLRYQNWSTPANGTKYFWLVIGEVEE